MKSFSEIETTSKRASEAAGYSWGISEEIGKSVRILEMFGLPGVKNLVDYYNLRKEKKFENLKLINKQNKAEKNQFCPIVSGISWVILRSMVLLSIISKAKFSCFAKVINVCSSSIFSSINSVSYRPLSTSFLCSIISDTESSSRI